MASAPTNSSFRDIVDGIVRPALGLDLREVDVEGLSRSVERRMAAIGQTDLWRYVDTLRGSRDELQALSEELVVLESWFFRDGEPFRLLSSHIANVTPTGAPWRVLCIPCAAGQEPYSVAMTFLDLGLQGRFQVDGVDLSHVALGRAREACYSASAFRGNDLTYRDRYFSAGDDVWTLNQSVRQSVRFLQGNLLQPSWWDGTPYDVLFCRNLLIYFDDDARSRAFEQIDRLLRPEGLLIVGATEVPHVPRDRFEPIDHRLGFGFHARPTPTPAPVTPAVTTAHTARLTSGARRAARPTPARRPTRPDDSLNQARRSADSGDLREALRLLEVHRQLYGADVTALTLAGVVHDAARNADEAERCLQQAVYLDPSCEDALLHLALLVERRGDADGARRLRERAARADASGESP